MELSSLSKCPAFVTNGFSRSKAKKQSEMIKKKQHLHLKETRYIIRELAIVNFILRTFG